VRQDAFEQDSACSGRSQALHTGVVPSLCLSLVLRDWFDCGVLGPFLSAQGRAARLCMPWQERTGFWTRHVMELQIGSGNNAGGSLRGCSSAEDDPYSKDMGGKGGGGRCCFKLRSSPVRWHRSSKS